MEDKEEGEITDSEFASDDVQGSHDSEMSSDLDPGTSSGGDDLSLEASALAARVKRSVLVCNMSPEATELDVRSALERFGRVKSVEIVKDLLSFPVLSMGRAMVEMQSEIDAQNVLTQLHKALFMIGGWPRPVTAIPATESMFADSPQRRQTLRPKLSAKCIGREDPLCALALEWKELAIRHEFEAEYLENEQMRIRQELADEQEHEASRLIETLELIHEAYCDGTLKRLKDAHLYSGEQSLRAS